MKLTFGRYTVEDWEYTDNFFSWKRDFIDYKRHVLYCGRIIVYRRHDCWDGEYENNWSISAEGDVFTFFKKVRIPTFYDTYENDKQAKLVADDLILKMIKLKAFL